MQHGEQRSATFEAALVSTNRWLEVVHVSADNEDFVPASAGSARDDDPRADRLFQVAALAGVATLPLALIALTISDPTAVANVNPGSSDAELLDALVNSRTEQAWGSTLLALAAVALWVFLGPLWARVRRGSEWLALVAAIGGVVVGVVLLFTAGMALVAWVAADYSDAGAARFLVVAGWETARVAVAPALVMVGATMLAGMRHGVFGSGMNLFSGMFTILLLVGLIPASPAGLMGLVVNLWVLVVALTLAFGNPPFINARRDTLRG
jgi:hypothetical protein